MEASILGSGLYLPADKKTNKELEEDLELGEGFIESHTGILERRWPNDHETIEYMALKASLMAVRDARISRIERIIVSRDAILTQRASSIGLSIIQGLSQEGIDVDGCFSIDVANYCPGLIHSANIAKLMVMAGEAENVLVVASTRYADLINLNSAFNSSFKIGFSKLSPEVKQFSLRDTSKGSYQAPRLNAFLWGNGAGALVVGKAAGNGEIISYDAKGSVLFAYDSYGLGEDLRGQSFGALDGTSIYKFAVKEVPVFIERFLCSQGLTPDQIDCFIPHQPNPRMLRALAEKIPAFKSKMEVTCDVLGNMIGASIPITYHLAKENNRIKSGDYVLMCSFGDSYLTASGLLFRER